jgi:uncharacterized protein (TIGR03086 family)
MTKPTVTKPRPAEVAWLLEPSISYALAEVAAVTPEFLSRPTPCREWDLRMLLRHACESLATIGAGIEAGRVGLNPAAEDDNVAADPARAFRGRARHLLDKWANPCRVIEIEGCPLAAGVMAATAALEIAVHGWDITRACGRGQPIPPVLATDLLVIAAVLVPQTGRHPLFAAPVTVAVTASPSDRLAAFLGRIPTSVSVKSNITNWR